MKKLILLILIVLAAASCSRRQEDGQTSTALDEQKTVLVDSAAVTGDYKVTLVELGSTTCIPCKAMKKVLAELKEKYKDQINIVFHDVKTEPGKPFGRLYQVRLIPTQVFLDAEGVEYHRHEGFFALEEVEKILLQKGVTLP